MTEYSKIDPTVKEQWVKALRSGDYKQGDGYLEKDGCNCCLGVLAKINVIPNDNIRSDGAKYFQFDDLYQSAYQPPDDYCGMNNTTLVKLMHMNDGTGPNAYEPKSFAEIADFIEENL